MADHTWSKILGDSDGDVAKGFTSRQAMSLCEHLTRNNLLSGWYFNLFCTIAAREATIAALRVTVELGDKWARAERNLRDWEATAREVGGYTFSKPLRTQHAALQPKLSDAIDAYRAHREASKPKPEGENGA